MSSSNKNQLTIKRVLAVLNRHLISRLTLALISFSISLLALLSTLLFLFLAAILAAVVLLLFLLRHVVVKRKQLVAISFAINRGLAHVAWTHGGELVCDVTFLFGDFHHQFIVAEME
jgi:uncharacterized membrane protein